MYSPIEPHKFGYKPKRQYISGEVRIDYNLFTIS